MRMVTRGLAAAAILISALLIVSRGSSQAQKANANANAQVERGRYLVEEVAMCGECHTPRNAHGELDKQAWLQGAPIWIMPVKPIPDWADNAPPLAGLPGMSEEEAERVLEQGTGPEGEVLRPPMHIYHMKPEDAKAIIAYLNSLPRTMR